MVFKSDKNTKKDIISTEPKEKVVKVENERANNNVAAAKPLEKVSDDNGSGRKESEIGYKDCNAPPLDPTLRS